MTAGHGRQPHLHAGCCIERRLWPQPSTATGSPAGGPRAQAHLRNIFVSLDILAVNQPQVLIGVSGQKFDADLKLTDQPTRDFI